MGGLVMQVLKWVEEAVQSSKIHLLSTDHYSGISNTWQIPFDPSLKEVTVALSGLQPLIEIRNPQGRLPHSPRHTHTQTHTHTSTHILTHDM